MAMTNIDVVSIDTSQAQQSISDLKQRMIDLQQQLEKLDKTSQEYEDTLNNLSAAQQQYDDAVSNTIDVAKQLDVVTESAAGAADSVEGLSGMLSQLTSTGSGASQMLSLLGKAEVSSMFTGATKAANMFNVSLKALAANPIIAILTALGLVISGLVKGIKSSEENTAKWNKVMATFRPVLDAITNTFQKLAGAILDAINWVIDIKQGFDDWKDSLNNTYPVLGNILNVVTTMINPFKALKAVMTELGIIEEDNVVTSKEYRQAAEDKLALAEKERKSKQELADLDAVISENRRIMMDKENYTEEERIAAQEAAKKATEEKFAIEKSIAQEKLRLLQLDAQATANDAEVNNKLAEAEAEVSRLAKEENDALRMLERTKVNDSKATNSETEAERKRSASNYDKSVEAIQAEKDYRKERELNAYLETLDHKQKIEYWESEIAKCKEQISNVSMYSAEYYKLYGKLINLEKSLDSERDGYSNNEKRRQDSAIQRFKDLINQRSLAFQDETDTDLVNAFDKDTETNWLADPTQSFDTEAFDNFLNELKDKRQQLEDEINAAIENNTDNFDYESKLDQYENYTKRIENATKTHNKNLDNLNKERTDKEEDEAKKRAKIEELAKFEIANSTANMLGSLAGLFDESTNEYKGLKIAETVISTLTAIMKTWEAYSDIPVVGPIIAGAQTAALAATGATTISKISSVTKNSNGSELNGVGNSISYPSLSATNVLNTDIAAMNQTQQLTGITNNMQDTRVYVAIDDINEAQNTKRVTTSYATY